jgi:hypothetical protein
MIALTFLKQHNKIQAMYENTETRSSILLAVSVEDAFFFFVVKILIFWKIIHNYGVHKCR